MKKLNDNYVLSESEMLTVISVFWKMMNNPGLDYMIGSMTRKEMEELYFSFKYAPLCEKHGVASWRDLTPENIMFAYESGDI